MKQMGLYRLWVVLLGLALLCGGCAAPREVQPTPEPTATVAVTPTPTPTPTPTAEPAADYILNTNTEKFHLPTCSSVNQMNEENKWYFTGSREKILSMGYQPCKRCCP